MNTCRKCWKHERKMSRVSLEGLPLVKQLKHLFLLDRFISCWFYFLHFPSDEVFPSHLSPVICLSLSLSTLVAQLLLFNFLHPSCLRVCPSPFLLPLTLTPLSQCLSVHVSWHQKYIFKTSIVPLTGISCLCVCVSWVKPCSVLFLFCFFYHVGDMHK